MAAKEIEAAVDKPQEWTTIRVQIEDGRDMSRLAALRGQTAAEAYRDYCAPAVRQALREASQALAQDLAREGV